MEIQDSGKPSGKATDENGLERTIRRRFAVRFLWLGLVLAAAVPFLGWRIYRLVQRTNAVANECSATRINVFIERRGYVIENEVVDGPEGVVGHVRDRLRSGEHYELRIHAEPSDPRAMQLSMFLLQHGFESGVVPVADGR